MLRLEKSPCRWLGIYHLKKPTAALCEEQPPQMLKLQSYLCSFVVGLLAASLGFGSLGPPSCPFYWVVQGFFKGLVHAMLQIAQHGTARAAVVEGRFLECARYSCVLRVAISARDRKSVV